MGYDIISILRCQHYIMVSYVVSIGIFAFEICPGGAEADLRSEHLYKVETPARVSAGLLNAYVWGETGEAPPAADKASLFRGSGTIGGPDRDGNRQAATVSKGS